jgi:hypothetical protein
MVASAGEISKGIAGSSVVVPSLSVSPELDDEVWEPELDDVVSSAEVVVSLAPVPSVTVSAESLDPVSLLARPESSPQATSASTQSEREQEKDKDKDKDKDKRERE